MSHYLYKLTLPNGNSKSGQVTGKTEEDARERLKELYAYASLQSLRPKPVTPAPTKASHPKPAALPTAQIVPSAKVSAAVTKPVTAKATKLDKLLYLQNGKCFFCGRVLTKAEASVEHLLPKSKGGTDADGNVVACCVTLNRTFGNMELRDKVKFVLAQKGEFRCPKA